MEKHLLNKDCAKTCLNTVLIIAIIGLIGISLNADGQNRPNYRAPQDTVKLRRAPDAALTVYKRYQQPYQADSRMVGAAVKAAELLSDTTKYNAQQGILLENLFSEEDLAYFAKQKVNGVVALFELVNSYLPHGKIIIFHTDKESNVFSAQNPLVLKNLRAIIGSKPATLANDLPQWKENVYQAYMARDYGTKLNNTITITSATREMRETPDLQITDFDGSTLKIGKLLSRAQGTSNDKAKAEKLAVEEFRARTYPSDQISKETANTNYRQALFELMRLQEEDIKNHPQSIKLIADLTNDLSKGQESLVIKGLKNSLFFDTNVPGNLGPVLLTENQVINPDQLKQNAADKAMELMMLTALHYGERDAIKLFRYLLQGKGQVVAADTKGFTPKRLNELTDHGTEKLKSLGYGKNKTVSMTFADLVLVAVSAPEAPVIITPKVYLTLNQLSNRQVGENIVNYYNTVNVQQSTNVLLFNPRISVGSRHTEYRASFDAVDFVPEILNGLAIDQKGSRVAENGVEIRLASDIYFSNTAKMLKRGLKPFFFPQFGVILGLGNRSVGYDNSTTPGPLGAVPQFKNTYITWGGHAGLNVSAFLLSVDATYITTPKNNEEPNIRFFDLSQGMTYYRYSLLIHLIDFGLGKTEQGKGSHFILDAEYAGETNNTGIGNRTITKNGSGQIGNSQWSRDYMRAHPNGVYSLQEATQMLINGDVKANYASSSYGALHIGLRKSDFLLKATGGLYNLYTVTGKNLINGQLFKNTINGNFFGGISLTYNLGSSILTATHKKTESYQIKNNVESPHKVDESSSEEKSGVSVRDRAIFTNKKSRAKMSTNLN
ncbi:hypothetical protein [Mucilaginibacter sp. UYCu711]|uniref:hypothetical protein n=1 Tax=Mucilaginibacter sp. UYCu711 TaxID=3156339 RepID=UPI003D22894F